MYDTVGCFGHLCVLSLCTRLRLKVQTGSVTKMPSTTCVVKHQDLSSRYVKTDEDRGIVQLLALA